MKILALDFETSGTDPSRHAPVQLGLAVMDGNDVLASAEWIIGPTLHWKTGKIEREYSVTALEVSGLSWKAIKTAPLPAAIVSEARRFVAENSAEHLPVWAYNASFDHGFMSTLMFLASDWHPTVRGVKVRPKPFLLGGWHCAMEFAMNSLDLEDYKLDTVAAHFGLSRSTDKHGALEDSILAGRVYHALCGIRAQEAVA